VAPQRELHGEGEDEERGGRGGGRCATHAMRCDAMRCVRFSFRERSARTRRAPIQRVGICPHMAFTAEETKANVRARALDSGQDA